MILVCHGRELGNIGKGRPSKAIRIWLCHQRRPLILCYIYFQNSSPWLDYESYSAEDSSASLVISCIRRLPNSIIISIYRHICYVPIPSSFPTLVLVITRKADAEAGETKSGSLEFWSHFGRLSASWLVEWGWWRSQLNFGSPVRMISRGIHILIMYDIFPQESPSIYRAKTLLSLALSPPKAELWIEITG